MSGYAYVLSPDRAAESVATASALTPTPYGPSFCSSTFQDASPFALSGSQRGGQPGAHHEPPGGSHRRRSHGVQTAHTLDQPLDGFRRRRQRLGTSFVERGPIEPPPAGERGERPSPHEPSSCVRSDVSAIAGTPDTSGDCGAAARTVGTLAEERRRLGGISSAWNNAHPRATHGQGASS